MFCSSTPVWWTVAAGGTSSTGSRPRIDASATTRGATGRRREPEPPSTTALLDAIDRAEAAEDLAEVNRLEAWLWLDGPEAAEGRARGAARELFLEMNGHALAAGDPGPQAEAEPAWPRLNEISVPTTVMSGDLDLLRLRDLSRALAATIPHARHLELRRVAHLPHLEGDAATLDAIVGAVA